MSLIDLALIVAGVVLGGTSVVVLGWPTIAIALGVLLFVTIVESYSGEEEEV